jgi:adenosylcobinamide-GDP ribazoletransferase
MNEAPPAPQEAPRLTDVLVAASLLTRLPMPIDHEAAGARLSRAGWAYPLVGALVGAAVGGAMTGLASLGMPPLFAATLAVAFGLLLTGALHEDGLADCADGFGGGHTVAKRLEIMRDSRLGTFGGAALMLALLAKVALLADLGAAALVAGTASGAVSRVPILWAPRLMPPARRDGLSASAGQPPLWSPVLALAVGAMVAVALLGAVAVPVMLGAAAAALGMGLTARRCIGGQSGDVLGAMQVLGELAALAVFTM